MEARERTRVRAVFEGPSFLPSTFYPGPPAEQRGGAARSGLLFDHPTLQGGRLWGSASTGAYAVFEACPFSSETVSEVEVGTNLDALFRRPLRPLTALNAVRDIAKPAPTGCCHRAGTPAAATCLQKRPIFSQTSSHPSIPIPSLFPFIGGTRFIGVYLARDLIKAGHEVTLLTRGKTPVTQQIPDDTDDSYKAYAAAVKHIKCDRKDEAGLKAALGNAGFQVVYDLNGREAEEAVPILDALPGLEQYIFCSSAGVYLKTDEPPHVEGDALDPKSRHVGKKNTEELLVKRGVNFTSIRPVYIYGPLNYNPVEEWFFHRIAAGRPIPIPGSGLQVTQLGHVKDLSDAFLAVLGNPAAAGQVYNIAGDRLVTFAGLARACAKAAGAPEPELIYYNPKDFDFGKAKAFPFRDQHFFTSVDKAKVELGWAPKFGLVEGLTDSYQKDFGRGGFRKAADFTTDDMILAKAKGLVTAA